MRWIAAAALVLICSPVAATDHFAVVGTTLVVPMIEGFDYSNGGPSFFNAATGAQFAVFQPSFVPDFEFEHALTDDAYVQAMLGNHEDASIDWVQMVKSGKVPFLVEEATVHTMGDQKSWAAFAGPHGRSFVGFFQDPASPHPVFNRNAVLAFLAQTTDLEPSITNDGVETRGLFLPTIAPFLNAEMDDLVNWPTLRTANGHAGPQVDLFMEGHEKAKQPLELIAGITPKEGVMISVVSSVQATLAGSPAVRVDVDFVEKNVNYKRVAYGAVIDGEAIVLSVRGKAPDVTPDIIADFDKIAAEVRRQNELDWASALGDVK